MLKRQERISGGAYSGVYGCFIGFYLKDMWLGEGGTFYCTNCKDDTMFHFDDFSSRIDFHKFPGGQTA